MSVCVPSGRCSATSAAATRTIDDESTLSRSWASTACHNRASCAASISGCEATSAVMLSPPPASRNRICTSGRVVSGSANSNPSNSAIPGLGYASSANFTRSPSPCESSALRAARCDAPCHELDHAMVAAVGSAHNATKPIRQSIRRVRSCKGISIFHERSRHRRRAISRNRS